MPSEMYMKKIQDWYWMYIHLLSFLYGNCNINANMVISLNTYYYYIIINYTGLQRNWRKH